MSRHSQIGWVTAAALAACGLNACGGAQAVKTVTVVTTAAREPAATTSPSQPHMTQASRRKARASSPMRACDANITVKRATTTCGFGENVFYGYWLNKKEPGVFADGPGIPAYSPATDRTFFVDCSGTSTIVCRAGDGGYVTFPTAAVSAYTTAQAKRYATAAQTSRLPVTILVRPILRRAKAATAAATAIPTTRVRASIPTRPTMTARAGAVTVRTTPAR